MIIEPFPILTTSRLALRQLSLLDKTEIFTLRSDSRVNKYLDRKLCVTMEDAEKFIMDVTENRLMYWAITLADYASLVGTICLFHFSDEKSRCELGFELLPDVQGQGIMSEAVSRIIEFAFQTLGLKEVEAFTHKDNRRSVKLLEKFRFMNTEEPDFSDPDYLIYKLQTSDFPEFA